MTEIKRYKEGGYGTSDMGLSDDGQRVDFEDHAAIVAALQEQRLALAAENVALKNSNNIANNILNDEETMVTSLLASSVKNVQFSTPATDAVLREIRARAVEEFCDLIKGYGKVEPDYFNPYFADLYAKVYKEIYESILDNPSVHDMESIVDWLEAGASNSRAYADMAIKYAAIRSGEQP